MVADPEVKSPKLRVSIVSQEVWGEVLTKAGSQLSYPVVAGGSSDQGPTLLQTVYEPCHPPKYLQLVLVTRMSTYYAA